MEELKIHLVDHAKPRSADGMAETFESTVDLAGDRAVMVVEAVQDIAGGLAARGDAEIFHRDEFGDREAIVDFHHGDLFAGMGDASLGVSALACDAGREKRRAIPTVVGHLLAVAEGHLECFDRDQVVFAQLSGDLRCGDDRTCCSIADTATIEQSKRVCDDRRRQHLLHADGLLEVRFGVAAAVVVAFD